MPRKVLMALVTPLLLAAAARADAGPAPLDISGAQFKPLPLAVSPVKGPAAEAKTLGDTLASDLDLSGLFELLDPRSFLASPDEGLSASSIDFSKWTAVGASSLIKGQISGTKTLDVELRLFDVTRGTQTVEASYSGDPSRLRAFAHDFADKVYKSFTGERGIFQTRLAYVKRMGADKQLFVCDFDGENARQVTSGAGGLNLLPAWSPDGSKLAFTSFRGGQPMLYVVDVQTRAAHALHPEGALQTGAAFSPDGKRIAFTMSVHGNSDIWVMNSDGTGLKNLTDSREIESSPAWSPDGKRLAFVSKRSGDPQIFVMNADGSGATRLTFQGSYNQTPDWSPRGDVIAFTARDERNVFDLFTVDVNTKQIKRLTQDEGNNEEPSFSPNGRNIVFTSTRRGSEPELFIMRADGTHQVPLGVKNASTPAWGPWTDE